MNLTQRLNHIINMWNAGYHPAMQEVFIKDTYDQIETINIIMEARLNNIRRLTQKLKDIDNIIKD
jgi:uncharacterized coiled-coil protein SlyX